MNSPEDNAARLTLKIAGVFQEVRDIWVRRLLEYYNQIESLIEGQWLGTDDMVKIISEAKSASKEALDGLGTDLSSELVHESRGVFGRFESERQSLIEEINDLRSSLSLAVSGDEGLIRNENQNLRHALLQVPEFQLLETIRSLGQTSYDNLAKISGSKKSNVRKLSKRLLDLGHVAIDKKARPHNILFLSAPWRGNGNLDPVTTAGNSPSHFTQASH
ncbi:MAG: hypothetical protein P1Q69_17385 [Candidatus Thorarchaeota archaeon]|nr:hypothetical protein [Candidatus Thorarchaeota archaeon]